MTVHLPFSPLISSYIILLKDLRVFSIDIIENTSLCVIKASSQTFCEQGILYIASIERIERREKLARALFVYSFWCAF